MVPIGLPKWLPIGLTNSPNRFKSFVRLQVTKNSKGFYWVGSIYEYFEIRFCRNRTEDSFSKLFLHSHDVITT